MDVDEYFISYVLGLDPEPEVVPSPEDLAWVDSVLVKDQETSEPNLDSLKDVLIEIIGQNSKILGSSLTENTGANDRIDSEILSPDIDEDGHVKGCQRKLSFPRYKGKMVTVSDSDEDLGLPKFAIETPPNEDIFKVWDLNIPVEEEDDELVKQLNEALSESSDAQKASMDKGMKMEESLDDLVDSIADLSID